MGDKKFKNLYGYYNKELTKGSYYTMFTRAYVKNDKGVSMRYLLLGLVKGERGTFHYKINKCNFRYVSFFSGL